MRKYEKFAKCVCVKIALSGFLTHGESGTFFNTSPRAIVLDGENFLTKGENMKFNFFRKKFVYFVSYTAPGRVGNVQLFLDHKITDIGQVRAIESWIMDDLQLKGVVTTSYIFLRRK